MNLSDLTEINRLSENLNSNMSLFKKYDGMLKNRCVWSNTVTINIGGDQYGNGLVTKINLPLQDCKSAVDEIARLRDEAWGKVVGIRAKMRSMGVEP